MSMQTPLLAESSHDATLSGPPETGEASALSRLIAESTPPSALIPFMASSTDETTEAVAPTPYRRASGTTILAGTLVLLQWGFVWGAFFSKDGWMNSHLQIQISWIQKYLPVVDKHTDVVIQKTSVFTMASNLQDDKEYGSLAGLWFCSVVLPCVFMIVCPLWILSDFSAPPRRYGANGSDRPNRSWLELTIRLSWLVVFILLALDVAIAGIQLQWDDTNLQVHNQLMGPYISYMLGCTCALLAVVVLRMPYLEHVRILAYPDNNNKPSEQQQATALVQADPSMEPTPEPAQHSPPVHAFRLGYLNSNEMSETERLASTTVANTSEQSPPSNIKPWQNFVAFQLGILALLLWLPTMCLPQFRVLFDGLVVQLVKTKGFNVYLWKLPLLVWHTGHKAGTSAWILILTFCLVLLFVMVIPVLAHAVASMIWLQQYQQEQSTTSNTTTTTTKRTLQLRDILKLLHPTMCGFPFALAMLVTVSSFADIGEDLDEDLCVQIENVIQNQCLVSGGLIMAGSWFFVAQSVALEAFVYFTLLWTAPKRPNITV